MCAGDATIRDTAGGYASSHGGDAPDPALDRLPRHDRRGRPLVLHAPSGTLIDPMLPARRLDALGAAEPQRIVLTNRHHYRHGRFPGLRLPGVCHEAGLHEFDGGARWRASRSATSWRRACGRTRSGCSRPRRRRVHSSVGGALAFADAVIRGDHGELGFVPDQLLGGAHEAIGDGAVAWPAVPLFSSSWDSLTPAPPPPTTSHSRANPSSASFQPPHRHPSTPVTSATTATPLGPNSAASAPGRDRR